MALLSRSDTVEGLRAAITKALGAHSGGARVSPIVNCASHTLSAWGAYDSRNYQSYESYTERVWVVCESLIRPSGGLLGATYKTVGASHKLLGAS